MLRLYDFPAPTGHSPKRVRTITPLQQFFVLNSPFIIRPGPKPVDPRVPPGPPSGPAVTPGAPPAVRTEGRSKRGGKGPISRQPPGPRGLAAVRPGSRWAATNSFSSTENTLPPLTTTDDQPARRRPGAVAVAGGPSPGPSPPLSAPCPPRDPVVHERGPYQADLSIPSRCWPSTPVSDPRRSSLEPSGRLRTDALALPFPAARRKGLEIRNCCPTSRGTPTACAWSAAPHRQPQPRPGPVADEQRHHLADGAEHGQLAELRAGETQNENPPGYVVFCPGRPVRFSVLWTSAFLPAEHQGTYINHKSLDPKQMIPYLRNANLDRPTQARQLELMRKVNRRHLARRQADPLLAARLKSMETAFRMQFAATEAFDLSRESQTVRQAYGTREFGNGCLLARRLVERGVRFVQVYYGNGQPWDTHKGDTTPDPPACAVTSTSPSPRCWTTWHDPGCSKTRWSSGAGNSDARQPPISPRAREPTAATTTTTDSRWGLGPGKVA
ncbi:MAG: hypothetical protein Ct9H300mP1_11230 [Planctomycetaceae bacterium]|nr:MAG: hypothetical protein Ct9H300mP1_11230 [Planctomycetaceae bacterium]